jgi:hypothetical protein
MKEATGSSEMLVNIYHTTGATFYKPVIFNITALRILNLLVMCMHGVRPLEFSPFQPQF